MSGNKISALQSVCVCVFSVHCCVYARLNRILKYVWFEYVSVSVQNMVIRSDADVIVSTLISIYGVCETCEET